MDPLSPVVASVALVYALTLVYATGAKLWARHCSTPPPADLPERPPLLVELPAHPHSNQGWKQPNHDIYIACAAVDEDALRAVDPEARFSRHLCSDCEQMLEQHSLSHAEWAKQHNRIVRRHAHRSPWLWPLWVLWRPVELLSPHHGDPHR